MKGVFIPSIPVGAIKMLNRETGGTLTDQTVEAYFSNIQKVDPLRKRSMPDGDKRDSEFFFKVFEYLHPTSIEKRAAAEREKQMNGQGGYTSKERSGKIHVDVKETHRLIHEAADTVYDGFIQEFVKKFKDSELELGQKILENRGLEGVGTNKNEDNLYTEETKAIARRVMDEEGVTCEYASEVTKMMYLSDRFLSIPIRRGTHLAMRAQDTFFNPKEKGRLQDYIWGRIKDDRASQKLSFIHWKHPKITDAYVLMVVFLRAVFRLDHGGQIDPEIFPLDSEGRKMDDSNRRLFMKTAGKRLLGLPEFSEHVLRNVILTMAVYVVIEAGKDPETNPLIQHLLMETHTTMKILMTHYDEDRNARAAKGVSMYDIEGMFKVVGAVAAPVVGTGKGGVAAPTEEASASSASVGKDSGVTAAKEKAVLEKEEDLASKTREAEMEKAAREKAYERQEALAAKKFAVEQKALERQEALAAMEFAVKEKALTARGVLSAPQAPPAPQAPSALPVPPAPLPPLPQVWQAPQAPSYGAGAMAQMIGANPMQLQAQQQALQTQQALQQALHGVGAMMGGAMWQPYGPMMGGAMGVMGGAMGGAMRLVVRGAMGQMGPGAQAPSYGAMVQPLVSLKIHTL